MRMWMTDPAGMCDKHLLGEHVELHMFVGSMRLKRNLGGFTQAGVFEPASIASRHAALVAEMEARGMRHKTPLAPEDVPPGYDGRVSISASLKELHRRCPVCRAGKRR